MSKHHSAHGLEAEKVCLLRIEAYLSRGCLLAKTAVWRCGLPAEKIINA